MDVQGRIKAKAKCCGFVTRSWNSTASYRESAVGVARLLGREHMATLCAGVIAAARCASVNGW